MFAEEQLCLHVKISQLRLMECQSQNFPLISEGFAKTLHSKLQMHSSIANLITQVLPTKTTDL